MKGSQKITKEKKSSKSSEVLYLFLAFISIGLVFFLALFILRTVLTGDSEGDNEVNIELGDENSIVLLDANDGSNCDNFEAQTKDLFNSINVDRSWYLIGSEFTAEQKRIKVDLALNKSIEDVSKDIKKFDILYSIAGESTSDPITSENGTNFSGYLDITNVSPAKQKVVAVANTSCGQITSMAREVNVSHPIYVVWTLDWEGKYVPQSYLNSIAAVTAKHNNMQATHFFNPRSLSPSTSAGDKQRYLAWVKDRRDRLGEPIQLHLHMFYDLVGYAGVTAKTSPAWGWNNSTAERGYDVIVSGYSYDEMNKILEYSENIFEANGLGTPTMFRAGGWQADLGTLQVLEDRNYLVDSSGRDRFTLGSNNIPVPWLLEATTQPYHPATWSQNEVNAKKSEQMNLWEFPNNGLDSTANNTAFLYDRFTQNYNGSPLTERTTVNYLSHPDYFNYDNANIDGTFNLIDAHAYSADKGPMIYEDLYDVYMFWEND